MTDKDHKTPSDVPILFVKPKAISSEDKATLKDAGVIVIEILDPKEVKFMRANSEIASNDLLNAAIDAISASADYTKAAFGKAIAAHLTARRK